MIDRNLAGLGYNSAGNGFQSSGTSVGRNMSTESKPTYAHIVQTPGVCGGKARIDGHRIRVQDIAILHEWHGFPPEEICRQYPTLTLAEVHSALAYYFDHRDQVQAEIQSDHEAVERFKREHPESVL
jgi:uncharacterized protein (DUF433 family)